MSVNETPNLSRSCITEQLTRILGSRTFARAHYLNRFLRVAVEETLRGNSGQLKELWLGREVFGRDQLFDPTSDPIVRVQARRLREKLTLYYKNEGPGDPVRISIPTGSYVPVFSTFQRPATPEGDRKIAVLPLTSPDGSEGSMQFAGIVTKELNEALRKPPHAALGKPPNAAYVVAGSVSLAESYFRIFLQLTEARTGRHCWSGWFEQRNTRLHPDARRLAALLCAEIAGPGGYSTSANPRFI
jgi:hypothetical protein